MSTTDLRTCALPICNVWDGIKATDIQDEFKCYPFPVTNSNYCASSAISASAALIMIAHSIRFFCSYDLIVPKFQKFAESRHQDKYYVRGTYTHFNTDFSKDVLHLADLGFKQISVEPVVAQPTDEYALKDSDLPVLFDEYDRLEDVCSSDL